MDSHTTFGVVFIEEILYVHTVELENVIVSF